MSKLGLISSGPIAAADLKWAPLVPQLVTMIERDPGGVMS
jgi:hypothetical protein